MKRDVFSDAVSEIDAKYYEEAENYKKEKHFNFKKFGIIAACICFFLLGGITTLALSGAGSEIIDLIIRRENPSETETSLIFDADVQKFKISELGEDMQAVGPKIKEQHDNFSFFSSRMPNFYYKNFETSADALEFIGLDKIKYSETDIGQILRVHISVMGDEKGNIQSFSLETHRMDKNSGISIQSFINVYTEHSSVNNKIGFSTVSSEELRTQESEFLTPSGLNCILVYTDRASSKDSYDAHIVYGGIWYHFYITFPSELKDGALKTVQDWSNNY